MSSRRPGRFPSPLRAELTTDGPDGTSGRPHRTGRGGVRRGRPRRPDVMRLEERLLLCIDGGLDDDPGGPLASYLLVGELPAAQVSPLETGVAAGTGAFHPLSGVPQL